MVHIKACALCSTLIALYKHMPEVVFCARNWKYVHRNYTNTEIPYQLWCYIPKEIIWLAKPRPYDTFMCVGSLKSWWFASWSKNFLLYATWSPPLYLILSQLNNFIPWHPVFPTFILVLSSHLCLSLWSGLLPWNFLTKIWYTFVISSVNSNFI